MPGPAGRVRGSGLDRHLSVLRLDSLNVADCTRFYQSVLESWQLFQVSREQGMVPAQWLLEQPLFGNPLIALGGSSTAGLQELFIRAVICKHGCSCEGEEQLENLTSLVGGEDLVFPEPHVSVAVDGWPERWGYILSFHSITLGRFEEVGNAAVYGLCVKVLPLIELTDVRHNKWQRGFTDAFMQAGGWRCVDKQLTRGLVRGLPPVFMWVI